MMFVGIPVVLAPHRVRRIDDETPILPYVVADTVVAEASRFVKLEFPAHYEDWLVEKADICYARHAHFRRRLNERGNGGRDWLYVFMRHWLSSLLKLERPDLFVLFPHEWTLGHAIGGTSDGRRRNYVGFEPARRCWREPSRVNPLLTPPPPDRTPIRAPPAK